MNLNSVNHINAIFNYYKENPGCDPNVYEFIQVCDEVSKDLNATSPRYGIYGGGDHTKEDAHKMYPEAAKVEDTFNTFNSVFYEKLLNCGIDIDKSSPLYQFCFENAYHALCYDGNTEEGLELNKMLGGVSFYILQQQRDVKNGLIDSFKYDNDNEFNRMLELHKKVMNPSISKVANGVSIDVPTPRDQLAFFIGKNYNVEYKNKEKTM